MRRAGLVGRVDRIAATRSHVCSRALVRRIAADEGITESELLAEMREMTAICLEQGITSESAMVRHWAMELGISQATLDEWTERYREWMQ